LKLRNKVLAGLAAGVLTSTSLISPAFASENQSLAEVLDVENAAFDKNWADFDILTAAVNAVLEAKPDSAVAVLADPETELTAFVPTDRAFRKLVRDLTGKTLKREANVFKVVASLGIDTVEQVLLYHVVLGAPIDREAALGAGGADLETAQGATIRVRVGTSIVLVDKVKKIANPKVFLARADINSGSNQIAHAIDRVLLPVRP
jgi:uncharacterized surface protein with fasciclin (FAS1) repeats